MFLLKLKEFTPKCVFFFTGNNDIVHVTMTKPKPVKLQFFKTCYLKLQKYRH